MKPLRAALVFAAVLSGCASVDSGPGAGQGGGETDYRSDTEVQMDRNPVNCVVIRLIDAVTTNDLQGFRGIYRWAGFEAGDDFIRLRKMMLTSPMPFNLRMDPPIYEVSGRGEADLARIRARLTCKPGGETYGDGFVPREVRAIGLESIDDKCRIELFFDGSRYMISRVVWTGGK